MSNKNYKVKDLLWIIGYEVQGLKGNLGLQLWGQGLGLTCYIGYGLHVIRYIG